jgi:glutamate synthase domain-containing protein 2
MLRELSDGLPIGIKMCVGNPSEVAALCKAMVNANTGVDFITVDGAEG